MEALGPLVLLLTGTVAFITGAAIVVAPSITSRRVFPNVETHPDRWRGVGLLIASLGTLLVLAPTLG